MVVGGGGRDGREGVGGGGVGTGRKGERGGGRDQCVSAGTFQGLLRPDYTSIKPRA